MKIKSTILTILGGLTATLGAFGAGTLTPINSAQKPIEIRSHDVEIIINNGFAKVQVSQIFYNPNPTDLEAVYAFPVPEDASLSEMSFASGETTLNGEVIAKEQADQIYEDEKSKGNQTGQGTQNNFQNFEFRVYPVQAQSEAHLKFVYYQPIELTANIGRLLYPLQEGGTDEAAIAFWTANTKVTNSFSARVELRSEYPIKDLRVPGFNGEFTQLDENRYQWLYQSLQGGDLDQDLVVYYRLEENTPGRVDLLTYRDPASDHGTFMLVITPGIDLKPLNAGADYLFVLDKSGSMGGKIATLADGVSRALDKLSDLDRFRIIVFDNRAFEITSSWVPATEANVKAWIERIRNVPASGGTNIYDGLSLALRRLDQDRVTNLLLVTDGVTNVGNLEPKHFDRLLRSHDLRFFGYLLGNSANWPLMRTLTEATDGKYRSVSTADDIFGVILEARDQITTEALLDVDLSIKGVKISDVSRNAWRKLYRGQQLVLIGHYRGHGDAKLDLGVRTSQGTQNYRTTVHFPQGDTTYPELERIWANARIQQIERQRDLGVMPEEEAKQGIQDLGIKYQIVTDETSILLLDDARFDQYQIERRNRDRTAIEHQAQNQRATQPVQPTRADREEPMFNFPAPHAGGGSFEGPVAILLGIFGWRLFAKKRKTS
ncbi:MAG: VIT domain-containing protein [Puniceicoccaceae bacterium]